MTLREPELLFRRFEEDAGTKGGARHKFQLLVTDLVKLQHPSASTVEGPGGRDWGIDTYVGELNGALNVWQSKFLLQWKTRHPQDQVRSSFKHVVKAASQHGFAVKSWTLCVPCILSPDQQKWFDGWADRMLRLHAIDVTLWNGTELRHRLLDKNARDIAAAYFPELARATRLAPRSAYLDQVRDIEAESLDERDVELAELEAFCRGDETYVWWRGAPWAGKSALMAAFVLHPPPGVEVVSFFITRRLEGQASGAAFTKAMSEQLADIIGERASPATGWEEVHLRQLLMNAAEVVVARNQKLIVVVDGLDEAQGKGIAAQLPKHPKPGVKIIVTGREHPKLPADYLDNDHPLLRCRVRILHPSVEALQTKRLAEWELKEGILKDGSDTIRHLLGLVVSARGLSAADLHDLTGLEPYKVEELAVGQHARTFETRANPGYANDRVILLAHDELQTQAANALGEPKLAEHRQELHDWGAGTGIVAGPRKHPCFCSSAIHDYCCPEAMRHGLARLPPTRTGTNACVLSPAPMRRRSPSST